MQLTLVLETAAALAGAAPDRIEFGGRRSLGIGRAPGVDWQLPDSERLISGLHCEIRREQGGYFVHDLSANGTFVNGAASRLAAPHRLRDGDTLRLGRCVIRARLSEAAPDADGTLNLRGVETLPPAPAGPALRLVLSPETAAGQGGPTGIDLQPGTHLRIGRDPEAHWMLTDGSGRMSRIHCEIRFEDGAFHLHDLSRNGTFVDGRSERIAGAHKLRAGDRFALGEFVVQVVAAEREARPAPSRPVPASPPRRGGDPAATVLQAAADIEATRLTLPARDGAVTPLGAAPIAALASGLGLAAADLAETDPAVLCEAVGALLRLVAEELGPLLAGRAEHQPAATPRERLRPQGNNPLEVLPPDEALRMMFGPPRRTYLDATRSLRVSFERLRRAFAALDRAAPDATRGLLQQLSPESITEAAPRPGPLGRLVQTNKAALWDEYVRRWSAAVATAAATSTSTSTGAPEPPLPTPRSPPA